MDCFAQDLQDFAFITFGMHDMIEALIVISIVIASFCLGNLIGFETGRQSFFKAQLEAKREADLRAYLRLSRQETERNLDHLSRQALAFSNKEKQWIKVYDAEVE